jgi:hypothetical protein
MDALNNFYTSLQEFKKMRATLEDCKFIQTFTVTTNTKNLASNNILYNCLIMFCDYIIDKKYYDENMFLCFRQLTASHHLDNCFIKLVKYGCLKTMAAYLKAFSNVIRKFSPYCKKNQNLTNFIINNYEKNVDYLDLYQDIIFYGNTEMYYALESKIIEIIKSPHYHLRTKSVEMFHIIANNFPKLITYQISSFPLTRESVIIKLLEIDALNNNLMLQCDCYELYPEYKNKIFSVMMENNFDIDSWHNIFILSFRYEAAQKVLFYFLKKFSVKNILTELSKIFCSALSDEKHNVHVGILNFYNLVDINCADPIKINVVKTCIYENIKKSN